MICHLQKKAFTGSSIENILGMSIVLTVDTLSYTTLAGKLINH